MTASESEPDRQPWKILAAAAFAHFFGLASIGQHAFGIFILPLQHEFGWVRADIAFANAIMMVALIVSAPLAGMVADRLGTRPLLLGSTLGMGIALACMAFMTTISEFYLAYLIVGTLGVGTIGPIYIRLIFAWFKRHKGLALGLVMGGGTASTILLPPVLHFIIETHGWRAAYIFLAAVEVLAVFPLLYLVVRSYPPTGQAVEGRDRTANADSEIEGVAFGEVIRSPIFYMLCFLFFILAVGQSVYIHFIPLVVDRGISASTAAFAASVLGSTALLARLITGAALDHFRVRTVAIILLAFAAVGMAFLMLSHSVAGIFLGALLVGVIYGGEGDVMGFFILTYFGRRSYARAHTSVFSCYVGGTAIGVIFTGSMFDRFGNYTIPLAIGAGSALFAIIILWFFDRSGARQLARTGTGRH